MPLTPSSRSGAKAGRRASQALFMVFALVGVVFATWAGRLPAIRDALGLSPGELGLLLLVGTAGSLVALPLTGTVVHRFGTRTTTRMAALLAAVSLTATSLAVQAGDPQLAAGLLFVAMMGISAWDVSMNLQGTIVERHLGRAIMPRFHAGFSLGAVAGAGLAAVLAAAGVPFAWHLITVVTLATAAVWALTGSYLPDGAVSGHHPGDPRAARAGRRALAAWAEPRTLLVGAMVFGAGLTEGSATDWLALSVVDGFGASQALGALAFGVFVAAMTLMRFAGTRLLDRFGRVPVLRLSAGLALVGLLAFGLVPTLPLALAAIALWGVGAALGFPVGMSAAADDPAHAAARVSVVSTIGYLAFLAGPPVLGMLADHVGYRHALLVIAIPLLGNLLLASAAAPLRGPSPPAPDTAPDPGSAADPIREGGSGLHFRQPSEQAD